MVGCVLGLGFGGVEVEHSRLQHSLYKFLMLIILGVVVIIIVIVTIIL